jgi:hypothetical protein
MKFLDEGVHQKEEMFDQKKNLVKKRYVLNETGNSAGAWLWIELGLVVGARPCQSMTEDFKDSIMLKPNLVEHEL